MNTYQAKQLMIALKQGGYVYREQLNPSSLRSLLKWGWIEKVEINNCFKLTEYCILRLSAQLADEIDVLNERLFSVMSRIGKLERHVGIGPAMPVKEKTAS